MQPQDDTAEILERLERAEQLKLDGHHQDALKILEQLLFDDPSNIAALEEVADNELSLGHEDRAEIAALQAISLDKESYTGHYILGFLRSRQSRWEEAVISLRRANTLKPNNAEILRCLGWALFQVGERVQGIVTLERSLNLEHDATLTLCDLGMVHLQMQNATKAKSLFQRVLELEPKHLRARELLTMAEHLEKLLLASHQASAQVSTRQPRLTAKKSQ